MAGGLDDALVWSRTGPETDALEKVFDGLHINSLLYFRPTAPYDIIIDYLVRQSQGVIEPQDCETRTFLHDLPVVSRFESDAVIAALKKRKGVIISSTKGNEGPAIIAHGTVSPEQAFVVASSICFACFVKFFSDYLAALQTRNATTQDHDAIDRAARHLTSDTLLVPKLMAAPFFSEEAVYKAIAQAGRQTVAQGLVDSYFGNISFCWNDTLYISQTGSSMDELAGCVDPVPLDGSSSAGITASSELSAHLETIARTGCRAILHGHPKFAVILSMDCPPEEKAACEAADVCHIKCPKPRQAAGVPVVPGEVGTGPFGLCHTLPPALTQHNAAIVYGHGLFTTGREDFNEAFRTLVRVENQCREDYFEKVKELRTAPMG